MKAHNWLPAIILSGCLCHAFAAEDCSGSTTISSQADATSLAKACKTYSGSVSIATGISAELSLDEIERIDTLTFENTTELTSISASSLRHVGSIYGSDSTILSSMGFPRLSTFHHGVKPTSVVIGETFLSSLDGLTPDGEMDEVNVCFNKYLQDITLDATSAGIITIVENNDRTHISFPNLKQAEDIEIGNASALDLPSLETITKGGLVVYSGTLKSLHLPSLKDADQGLYLRDLPRLSNLSMPALSHISYGDLELTNVGVSNPSLDALESVYGSIWIEGDYESVSLPKLTQLSGSFYMKGGKNFDCSAFSAQFAGLVNDRQSFTCIAGNEEYDYQDGTTSRVISTKSASATSTRTAASVYHTSAPSTPTPTAASVSEAATSAAVATGASAASRFGAGMATSGIVFGVVSFVLFLGGF